MALVLIRHAPSTADTDTPSRLWGLTEDGRRAAQALAEDAALQAVTLIATSPAAKAAQTAALVARGRPIVEVPDLRELDRSAAGWLATAAQHSELVRAIFQSPRQSVRRCERAADAQTRIVRAIDELVPTYPRETLAVVTHGILLSLYMAHLRGAATADFDAWRRMRLPDLAVVDPITRGIVRAFGAVANGYTA